MELSFACYFSTRVQNYVAFIKNTLAERSATLRSAAKLVGNVWSITFRVVEVASKEQLSPHGRRKPTRSGPDYLRCLIHAPRHLEPYEAAQPRPSGFRIFRHEDSRHCQRDPRTCVRNFLAGVCVWNLAAKAMGGANSVGLRRIRSYQYDSIYDEDPRTMGVASLWPWIRRDRTRGLVGFGYHA